MAKPITKAQETEASKTKSEQKLKERADAILLKNLKAEAKKFARRKYKTLKVDYTKLVSIKINAKTTIYAKPGMEQLETERFLANYSKLL